MMSPIVIRQEQLEALSIAFEDQQADENMVQHIRQCFPAEAEAMGPVRVSTLVSEARTKCLQQYGIADTLGLLYYLNLSMVLGQDFEQDSMFSWTSDILRRKDVASEARFDEIFERLDREGEAD